MAAPAEKLGEQGGILELDVLPWLQKEAGNHSLKELLERVFNK